MTRIFFAFSCLLIVLPSFATTTELLISEYGEGSSGNSKYIELYNGTGAAINLADYEIWRVSNGGTWPEATLALTGTLADGATYVIANNAGDVPGADLYSGVISWNGDDAAGLARLGTLIDAVGQDGPDPGTRWDVGTAGSTRDHRLIRKSTVCSPNTDWDASRGTTDANSEWTYVSYSTGAALVGHTATCAPVPEIQLSYQESDSACGFTLDFGAINLGSNNVQTVVIKNTGSAPLNVSSLLISGTHSADFTIFSGVAGTIPGGDSIVLQIEFDPSADGNRSALLTITSDDSDEGTCTVILEGEGAGPEFNFNDNALSLSENGGSVNIIVNQNIETTCDVEIVVKGGSAPTVDYNFSDPTLVSFNSVGTSRSTPFTTNDNGVTDGSRTVMLALRSATGGCDIGNDSILIITIQDDETPQPTDFFPGDLAIVGYDAAINSGPTDRIYFMTMVDINPGTEFIVANCSYENGAAPNVRSNTWDNDGFEPGIMEITYTGAVPIAAGSILSCDLPAFPNTAPAFGFTVNGAASPDFSVNKLGNSSCNISTSNPDQIHIMQGRFSGPNLEFFDGDVLFGLANGGFWVDFSSSPGTRLSRLHPDILCFNIESSTNRDVAYYPDSELHTGTKRQLLGNIKNNALWVNPFGNNNLNIPDPLASFTITTINPDGFWVGDVSTDWFDCSNWEGLSVPDINTEVFIESGAVRNCEADANSIYSDEYNDSAQCKNLNLKSTGANNNLSVLNGADLYTTGNINVEKNSGSGVLSITLLSASSMQADSLKLSGTAAAAQNAVFRSELNSNAATLNASLLIFEGGLLDLQGTVEGGSLSIAEDFINNESENEFLEDFSTVLFEGSFRQTITGSGHKEDFHDLVLNNSAGLEIENEIEIENELLFQNGSLFTLNDSVILTTDLGTVNGEANGQYVIGFLKTSRTVGTGTSDFGNSGLEIAAGVDDLGSVYMRRHSGPNAHVTVGGNESIDRTWTIIPDNEPVSGRDITFGWISDDDNAKNLLQAQVWHFNTMWNTVGPETDYSTRLATVNTSILDSLWTVSDNLNPLPFRQTFSHWTSDNEIIKINYELSGFENAETVCLEVLQDKHFKILSEKEFVSEKGFFIYGATNTYFQYRIKVIENNQAYYSKTHSVNLRTSNVLIFPNPASEGFTVQSSIGLEKLELYDYSGRLIENRVLNDNLRVNFSLNHIQSGAYMLLIYTKSGVVKERLLIDK